MHKRSSLVLGALEWVKIAKIAESFAKIGVPKIQTQNSLAGYLTSK